jgi:hypothetical protein
MGDTGKSEIGTTSVIDVSEYNKLDFKKLGAWTTQNKHLFEQMRTEVEALGQDRKDSDVMAILDKIFGDINPRAADLIIAAFFRASCDSVTRDNMTDKWSTTDKSEKKVDLDEKSDWSAIRKEPLKIDGEFKGRIDDARQNNLLPAAYHHAIHIEDQTIADQVDFFLECVGDVAKDIPLSISVFKRKGLGRIEISGEEVLEFVLKLKEKVKGGEYPHRKIFLHTRQARLEDISKDLSDEKWAQLQDNVLLWYQDYGTEKLLTDILERINLPGGRTWEHPALRQYTADIEGHEPRFVDGVTSMNLETKSPQPGLCARSQFNGTVPELIGVFRYGIIPQRFLQPYPAESLEAASASPVANLTATV